MFVGFPGAKVFPRGRLQDGGVIRGGRQGGREFRGAAAPLGGERGSGEQSGDHAEHTGGYRGVVKREEMEGKNGWPQPQPTKKECLATTENQAEYND